MKARFFFFLLMLMLSACVGTDLKDDPIISERIDVSRQQVAVQSGQNVQLMAEYYHQYGISRLVSLSWSSSDPQVASVDQTGLVQAIGPGQSIISATFGEFIGPLVNVNVNIDFLVRFKPIELVDYFDNYMSFKNDLKSLLGREIDLVEEQTLKNPILIQSINQSKELVYG